MTLAIECVFFTCFGKYRRILSQLLGVVFFLIVKMPRKIAVQDIRAVENDHITESQKWRALRMRVETRLQLEEDNGGDTKHTTRYAKRPDFYADLRGTTSVHALNERLQTVETLLLGHTAIQKRTPYRRTYAHRRLMMERSMLQRKIVIYGNGPMGSQSQLYHILRETETQWDEESRKEHALALITSLHSVSPRCQFMTVRGKFGLYSRIHVKR
jgi:hypothetical protein